MASNRILAFSHIPKTAGTTLNQILKRHFGHRHLSVEFRTPPPLYTMRDMAFDLSLSPNTQSMAGHTLKPYVDFGPFESRLVWYTFLRDPIDRFVSHYQHQYSSGVPKFKLPFVEWFQKFERRNWMVRMIAGAEDVDVAKDIIANKFSFVGLTERFNPSLVLLRHCLNIPDLEIDYPSSVNKAKNNHARREIFDNIHIYIEDIIAQNELDIELYNYVLNSVFDKQIEDYGRDRLEDDVASLFKCTKYSVGDHLSIISAEARRHLMYRPSVWLDKKFNYDSRP